MTNRILNTDASTGVWQLDEKSIHCCVTSPPYFGLRDYGAYPTEWPEITFRLNAFSPEITVPAMKCCLGMEPDPVSYTAHIVHIFRGVFRALRKDGTCWINLGDSYATTAKNRTVKQATEKSTLGGGKTTQCQILKQRNKVTPGLKNKDLIGIPWMVAFALRADGWYLRQDIIWNKPNPMPECVNDRCSKAHEYIFLLTKSRKYYFDAKAIRVPLKDASIARLAQDLENQNGSARMGDRKVNDNMKAVSKKGATQDIASGGSINRVGRSGYFDGDGNFLVGTHANKKSVWTVTTKPFKEAHFAVYPGELIEPCILAGCPYEGVVLDMFFGSGTTGIVAARNGRHYIGMEVNPKFVKLAERRLEKELGLFK